MSKIKFTLYPYLVSILLASGLVLAMLWLFQPAAGAAPQAISAAITWYVSAADGNDSDDCLTPATACASIAAAIQKASDGDDIQVAAGIYTEHDVEISKNVSLYGAGSAATIIDANQSGRVFNIYSTVSISGFQIQNGRTSPGSFFVQNGGAISTSGGAILDIQDSVLTNNYAAGIGGAIFNIG